MHFFAIWSLRPYFFGPWEGLPWHADTGQARGKRTAITLQLAKYLDLGTSHEFSVIDPYGSWAQQGRMQIGRKRENNTWMINNFFVLKEKNLKTEIKSGQVLTKRFHLLILVYEQWLIFKGIKTVFQIILKTPISTPMI